MTPMMCMAVAIFFEARNQPYDGMLAVGSVIETRVEDPRWPSTICGVVNQTKAFSYTHDGLSDNPLNYDSYHDRLAWIEAQQAAADVINGVDDFNMIATHYHADYVDPWWIDKMNFVGRVGDHVFYEEP